MKRVAVAGMMVLTVLVCMAPGMALADVVNTRPVPISAPSVGAEKLLQTFFNNSTGSTIDVDTDQSPWSIFMPTEGSSGTLTLRLEETVFDNSFGIYQQGNSSFMIPLLLADGLPGKVNLFTDVIFNADGVDGRVRVNRFDDKGDSISNATFNRFGSMFGFYLQHTESNVTRTFYSEDSLNNDSAKAHFLAFAGNGADLGMWYFGFEDSFDFAIDNDYNDYVTSAIGIKPVTALPPAGIPEPASLALLGAGFVGLRMLDGRRRRR